MAISEIPTIQAGAAISALGMPNRFRMGIGAQNQGHGGHGGHVGAGLHGEDAGFQDAVQNHLEGALVGGLNGLVPGALDQAAAITLFLVLGPGSPVHILVGDPGQGRDAGGDDGHNEADGKGDNDRCTVILRNFSDLAQQGKEAQRADGEVAGDNGHVALGVQLVKVNLVVPGTWCRCPRSAATRGRCPGKSGCRRWRPARTAPC